ncbi:hypothetical protein AMCSP12_001207 [Streptococcus pneumoniae 2070108]|nr:hypothetical protein AMCSP12_001207 [Streptococcus pneumoniae 2070108]
MKSKNGVPFGLLSGIFWGLGLTVSAYIFSIFYRFVTLCGGCNS